MIETDSGFYNNEGKRVYTTQHIQSNPPKIDGKLDDTCWDEGSWSGHYQQYLPAEGIPPSQETEIKILYDNQNMYVAIRAYDNEPEKIDRQMGRRDAFNGDMVGVCFDSYFDHRTGFEFDLSASGSKLDLMLLNDHWDTNWNAVWHGKVGLEDSAWTAEMQIPLSQLRYANLEEQIWGLHAWRWVNRNQEEDQWALIPRDTPGLLYSIGELYGVRGITQKRKVELMPYTVGKVRTYEKEPGNPYAPGRNQNVTLGLDGKFGISSDFTVDFTINPDFGQVEADPSVLNLTAFEVFFEEKRPFFLEGKNIMDFDFGEDLLFYSRRIGHRPMVSPDLNDNEYAEQVDFTTILGALKLTGKTKNGLSVGILESVTAQENVEITSGDIKRKEIVEPLTNYFVGRLQKDIKEGNTIIGGMMTSTNRSLNQRYLTHLNREAYTGGIDFSHFWHKKTYYVEAKTVFSHITGAPSAISNLQQSSARYFQRPDADYVELDTSLTQFSGHGGSIKVGKGSNGKWRYSVGLNWRSPGLELNDIGYLQMADIIQQNVSLGYVETEPKGIFRNYSIHVSQTNEWNFGGVFLRPRYSLNMVSMFSNKWGFQGSLIRFGHGWDTRLLRGGPAIWMKGFWHNRYSISTDQSRRVYFRAGYHFHFFDDKISYTNQVFGGITYKVSNPLQLSINADYWDIRDNYQYVDYIEDMNEDVYLLATIDRKNLGLTIRADYSITPDLTIQYYGSPYVSIGEYCNYKRVVNPEVTDLGDIYHVYGPAEISYDNSESCYLVDENVNDETDFVIDNPDYNFRQYRSNLVARWEYKPGSALFLVWTHGRSQYENISNLSLNDNISQLMNIHADNVFLLKFSYWFDL
ncbi:DUF5916 domain-containing protein [Bacteroidota bacterium]